MILPGDECLCEACTEEILDRPVSGEKEGTQTSSQGGKEWWA